MTHNQNRSTIIRFAIVVFALILISKLFYLQVLSDKYAEKSARLSIRDVIEFPDRGLITDRNGEIIVFNEDAHDLVVHFPFNKKEFEMDDFCRLVQMTPEEVTEKLKNARASRFNQKGLFIKNISTQDFARIQEGLIQIPAVCHGIKVRPKIQTQYCCAHTWVTSLKFRATSWSATTKSITTLAKTLARVA